MKELEYPFDSDWILKNSKKIRKQLLSEKTEVISKKIAVLGGSTTHDIIRMMELFLLNYGIKAEFYESEYNMYWQDAMFDNVQLQQFAPDIIYIHTSLRNIQEHPLIEESRQSIEQKEQDVYEHFHVMWDKLKEKYNCPIIQNNFEHPSYRLLGNKDVSDIHGYTHFANQLNERFYQYAQTQEDFYINDIQYLSASYGLSKWSDPLYWHMYKYCLCMQAIPELSFNISNIVKSIYGKNRKALVLDLDNTLWGGVIGDDGASNIEIGQETSVGQVFSEFQSYIKEQKQLGILLNVNSKNDLQNALDGLNHPESILHPDDFICLKANWESKDRNLMDIETELNLMENAFVFVDDNPAERAIINMSMPAVSAPQLGQPENYIRVLDRNAYFEVTKFSHDDMERTKMYKENLERSREEKTFADYKEYLHSLDMHALIRPFESVYMARIAQLTNKSNQFNLTTKRYTQSDIERMAQDPAYITLYGKLEDKFGDNGVVSVLAGRKEENVLHLDLWLMSCRVLKRDMEYAMMDTLVKICKEEHITKIRGYYYPTSKNSMVKNFYELQGFSKEDEDANGNTTWLYEVSGDTKLRNEVIRVNAE